MKVKDLINKLKDIDGDMDIYYYSDSHDEYYISGNNDIEECELYRWILADGKEFISYEKHWDDRIKSIKFNAIVI